MIYSYILLPCLILQYSICLSILFYLFLYYFPSLNFLALSITY
nr:MAG TPA: hypothetical protein [Caudoviricetes sp.]